MKAYRESGHRMILYRLVTIVDSLYEYYTGCYTMPWVYLIYGNRALWQRASAIFYQMTFL
jgi:hypothetical protein